MKNLWKNLTILAVCGMLTGCGMGSSTSDKAEAPPEDSKVLILTEANFDETIKSGVTLVDFWATWCPPCRLQGPIVEKVAEGIGDKAKVAKLDVDKAKAIAARFKIQSIPTLIVFKDGKPVEQLVGLRDENELTAAIEKAL